MTALQAALRRSSAYPALRSLNLARRRLIDRALYRVAVVLRRLDGVIRRGDEKVESGDDEDGPVSVLATVAHYRRSEAQHGDERSGYLSKCVTGLLGFDSESVAVIVITNRPASVAEALRSELSARSEAVPVDVVLSRRHLNLDGLRGRNVVVLRWRPGLIRRHGVYLTWAHLPILRAGHRLGRFSHLLYLEDDMHLTDQHFRYWRSYRNSLNGAGLIPGFVRFELFDGVEFLTDQVSPVVRGKSWRTVSSEAHPDGELVVNMPNPYQALYVLDRRLAEEHFRSSIMRSPLRSRVVSWDVRARAAAGPIFDDVPEGLGARNAVPVGQTGGEYALPRECLVEHMAATYASRPNHVLGSLRVDELFGVHE